jgi:hypothetical protein
MVGQKDAYAIIDVLLLKIPEQDIPIHQLHNMRKGSNKQHNFNH